VGRGPWTDDRPRSSASAQRAIIARLSMMLTIPGLLDHRLWDDGVRSARASYLSQRR
jgi:hypothetical protein